MPTKDAQRLDLTPDVVQHSWYRSATPPYMVHAEDEDGVPIDITGARAEMELKDLNEETLMQLSSDPGQGIIFTNPSNGDMRISPETIGTDDLPVGQVLYYDLKVKLADTTVLPFYRGIITVQNYKTVLDT